MDLRKAWPKGTPIPLTLTLTVRDLLERDLWSTNDWKTCRIQELDWTFTLSATVKQSGPKGVSLEAVLDAVKGTWKDQSPDDPARPEVDLAFPVEGAKPGPWVQVFAGLKGAKLLLEFGPSGGVTRVQGWAAASAKALGPLLEDPKTKALAKDLSAWFSDTAWTALLDAALPACIPVAGAKSTRGSPFPWTQDFGEPRLPAVPLEFKVEPGAEGTSVAAAFESGKVDQALRFPGQPGFHSLGTAQKGELRADYAPDGLRHGKVFWEVDDRWDNYRPSAKADRFERKVSFTLDVALPAS